jgi:hypothetical protein
MFGNPVAVDEDLETSQSERTRRALFDKVQEVGEFFVLAGIRSNRATISL